MCGHRPRRDRPAGSPLGQRGAEREQLGVRGEDPRGPLIPGEQTLVGGLVADDRPGLGPRGPHVARERRSEVRLGTGGGGRWERDRDDEHEGEGPLNAHLGAF